MKKIALMAMGLAGVLASCGPVALAFNPFVTTERSSVLNLHNVIEYRTSYQLSEAVRDVNTNITLPAGTYVICDNKVTDVETRFTWSGPLNSIYAQFEGVKSGEKTGAGLGTYSGASTAGDGTARFTFNPGMAPLSLESGLSAQSIVVNPITNVNVKGATQLKIIGVDPNKRVSNVIGASAALPVVNCG